MGRSEEVGRGTQMNIQLLLTSIESKLSYLGLKSIQNNLNGENNLDKAEQNLCSPESKTKVILGESYKITFFYKNRAISYTES